ncbi:MAG: hypothetical protein ACUVQ8_07855 [Nitrososphaeria archaeon]
MNALEELELKNMFILTYLDIQEQLSLLKKLTEAEMCQFFGWTLSSKMPAIYVHLSGRDLDKALLKASGIKGVEELKDVNNLVVCHFCKKVYSDEVEFCELCGRPLGREALEEFSEKESKLLNLFIQALSQKQFRKQFFKTLKKALRNRARDSTWKIKNQALER